MDNETEKLSAQLEDSQRKIQIMFAVSSELNKFLTLQEKLHGILKILDEQFGLKHSMILLPDKAQEKLTVFASHGYSEDISGQHVPFGQGLIGLAALRKRKINITGIRRKQYYVSIASPETGSRENVLPGLENAESQVAIPLLSNNELVAVLMAESENFCVFSRDDEDFLVTLAQPMGVSILNSMLFDNMEEKIRDRTAELQKLAQTKEKFFSIISHDLRSPVTSFHGISKMFRYYNERGDTTKIDELCSKVDYSINKLNDLLDNLLNWSLQQTNGIACHFERVQLRHFINDVAEIYNDSIAAKSMTIDIAVDDHIFIWGDYQTLATIFRNLLSNAIKFTSRGGKISISAKVKDISVVIYLEDNGVGIDNENLRSIFEIKERRTTPGTEKEKGTGLGLILVKEFIQLNKGTISIESEAKKGTRILITLPAAPITS